MSPETINIRKKLRSISDSQMISDKHYFINIIMLLKVIFTERKIIKMGTFMFGKINSVHFSLREIKSNNSESYLNCKTYVLKLHLKDLRFNRLIPAKVLIIVKFKR